MWLAKRGKGLPICDHAVSQGVFTKENLPLIVAPRRQQHSAKPDEAYSALERLFGEVRRIDMFGRTERPGWSAWGNEVVDPLAVAAE
jgi:N6-adenosine-specific RNA methylase IME4